MATTFTQLPAAPTPRYFYLLDVVRGFAALAVVLWHWQHFYVVNNDDLLPGFRVSAQPFYNVFYVFYQYGLVAVDLFFLISGFVFFYLYANSVAHKKVTAFSFAALRFSRLYPLHLLTLLAVGLLQIGYYHSNGNFFIYPFNDAYHFVLNLLFATSWGLEKGPSFNGPNWSVSVEVLLYCLFFVVCRYLAKKYVLPLFLLLGLALQMVYPPVGHGLYSFFGGGILYYLYLWLVRTDRQKNALKWMRILSIFFAVFILLNVKYGFVGSAETAGLSYLPLRSDPAFILPRIHDLFVRTFVFPVFLMYLVLLETVKGPQGKRLSFVGHISYSSYLLHFPLQLAVVFAGGSWQTNRLAFFNSNLTFLTFFSVLILLSLLSYHYFELPAQQYLRKKLIGKKTNRPVEQKSEP